MLFDRCGEQSGGKYFFYEENNVQLLYPTITYIQKIKKNDTFLIFDVFIGSMLGEQHSAL